MCRQPILWLWLILYVNSTHDNYQEIKQLPPGLFTNSTLARLFNSLIQRPRKVLPSSSNRLNKELLNSFVDPLTIYLLGTLWFYGSGFIRINGVLYRWEFKLKEMNWTCVGVSMWWVLVSHQRKTDEVSFTRQVCIPSSREMSFQG